MYIYNFIVFSHSYLLETEFSAIQPTMKGYLLVKSWGCHGKSMGRSRIVVDQLVDLWNKGMAITGDNGG